MAQRVRLLEEWPRGCQRWVAPVSLRQACACPVTWMLGTYVYRASTDAAPWVWAGGPTRSRDGRGSKHPGWKNTGQSMGAPGSRRAGEYLLPRLTVPALRVRAVNPCWEGAAQQYQPSNTESSTRHAGGSHSSPSFPACPVYPGRLISMPASYAKAAANVNAAESPGFAPTAAFREEGDMFSGDGAAGRQKRREKQPPLSSSSPLLLLPFP